MGEETKACAAPTNVSNIRTTSIPARAAGGDAERLLEAREEGVELVGRHDAALAVVRLKGRILEHVRRRVLTLAVCALLLLAPLVALSVASSASASHHSTRPAIDPEADPPRVALCMCTCCMCTWHASATARLVS